MRGQTCPKPWSCNLSWLCHRFRSGSRARLLVFIMTGKLWHLNLIKPRPPLGPLQTISQVHSTVFRTFQANTKLLVDILEREREWEQKYFWLKEFQKIKNEGSSADHHTQNTLLASHCNDKSCWANVEALFGNGGKQSCTIMVEPGYTTYFQILLLLSLFLFICSCHENLQKRFWPYAF